jgi:hypothetical protein
VLLVRACQIQLFQAYVKMSCRRLRHAPLPPIMPSEGLLQSQLASLGRLRPNCRDSRNTHYFTPAPQPQSPKPHAPKEELPGQQQEPDQAQATRQQQHIHCKTEAPARHRTCGITNTAK